MTVSPDQRDVSIYPWHILRRGRRPILAAVTSKWRKLLAARGFRESVYHKFVANHAGLFFPPEEIVISKPRLGSEYVPDFVVATDEASDGIHYEFIEIETPDSRTYTGGRHPSARLSRAIQQVVNWEAWLMENRRAAKKFFPSYRFMTSDFTNFGYSIVIGRRETEESMLARRNELARRLHVHIRSFEFFTQRILSHSCHDCLSTYIGTEVCKLPRWVRNALANPFSRAYSWEDWQRILERKGTSVFGEKTRFADSHFIPNNAEALLALRKYNGNYAKFLSFWDRLPGPRENLHLGLIDWR